MTKTNAERQRDFQRRRTQRIENLEATLLLAIFQAGGMVTHDGSKEHAVLEQLCERGLVKDSALGPGCTTWKTTRIASEVTVQAEPVRHPQ